MIFVLITFTLYVVAIAVKNAMKPNNISALQQYIESKNPKTEADVERLINSYYAKSMNFHV